MSPSPLRIRHVAFAFLIGSLLGFLTGPAHAGPLDKLKGKGTEQERQTQSIERSRSSDASRGRSQPNPEQQANLQDLRDSLGALAGGAAAAEDEIRGLAQDLHGMSLQPPDPALTQALAADLADAMADASLSPREVAELTQAVYAVMNSAGLSQDELKVLIADVEDILHASGVDRSDVQAVADDLQAIFDASQGQSPRGKSQGEARRRSEMRSNA